MRRLITIAAAVLGALAVAPAALADTPFPTPANTGVFIAAQTVTLDRAVTNSFAPGATVVFRAYAVDAKTHKALTKKTAKYFYVTIPNQPNVKLTFNAKAIGAVGRFAWTGRWTVPASYPTGVVHFKVLAKTTSKRSGSFVQIPGDTAMLTVSTNPQSPFGPGPGPVVPVSPVKTDLALYVDTVNGSRPVGAKPRSVGCTQTNVYRRGEQLVVRAWGNDLATGAALTPDNVTDAHYTVPGQQPVVLSWGAHGATKVYFWTNFWNIPATYPLGDVTVHVSFTDDAGKSGTLDYPITIIP